MDLAFDDEQEELRTTARDFLAKHAAPEQVREQMATELGFDRDTWRRICGELGWAAVAIPEAYGGLGLGHVELVALMEVMGESLCPGPFLSSVCLAAPVIERLGSELQKTELLSPLAEGTLLATLALVEPNGSWEASGIHATFERDGDGFVLRGQKRYVPDGCAADVLLVAAREPGSSGVDGVAVFRVPGDAPGLERRLLATLDQTRRQAAVELRDVRVGARDRLDAAASTWKELERALDLARVALAAEQVGGAQRCLEMAVAYAGERRQFGRPIGSFQAIKHKCADMMLAVESARSAAYYAGCLATADPESDAFPSVAALAKAYASDAYFQCAAEALQIHGGVGFTWEYDVHLYFKRARSSALLLGDPDSQRERIARHMGLDASG